MRVSLDTNVLAYLSDVGRGHGDAAKIATARSTVRMLEGRATIVVATQALGELFSLLTRSGMTRADARIVVLAISDAVDIAGSDYKAFLRAVDLAVAHRLQMWDSLILTASADVGCDLFLSEDLQDGFRLRGMTIANPFATPLQPALARLLAD